MGFWDRLFGAQREQMSGAPRSSGSGTGAAKKAAPARRKPAVRYRVVDVPGTWDRAVVGDQHFPGAVEALPLGPLKVTLRLKPNEANPYAVAAYVGRRQVGWLATDWAPTDEWFVWMKRLEAAGIRPRFKGEHKLREISRLHDIVFDFPGRYDDDLSVIADRLIAEKAPDQEK